jgi:hypothetical protein
MSRAYSMTVTVKKYNPEKLESIKDAGSAEWPFDDWFVYEGTLTGAAESNLCGGESEDQFAERLAKAIWVANEKFCEVDVCATFLEDLPHETYTMDRGIYDLLKESGALTKKEAEA